MYGAILGDLAGSIYEYSQTKKISSIIMEELIPTNSFYSDDTILTVAICDAIKSGRDYGEVLKEYILKYSHYHPSFSPYFSSPFSPGLMKWARGGREGNSQGNGCMMRISPVGYLFDTKDEVVEQARLATIPSHNSYDAIDASTTIALLIFYMRKGYSKEEVYSLLNLHPKYRPFQKFNVTASETIENCLYAFYQSSNLEDAISKTLLMGGDTDTNCCIVGSLAEAYYGMKDEYIQKIDKKIPREFVKVLKKDDK